MASSLLEVFLGALQAALSVLLTIFYGVLVGQFGIVDQDGAKQISKLCTEFFLPALLLSNMGSELHADTGAHYVPIILWSLTYTFSSLLLAMGLKRWLKLPSWTVPAISFNNTTSLPLLLVQTLDSTGILGVLLTSDSDTTSAAVNRAKSFFLVNSLCGNVLTFTLGPKLLDGKAPDQAEGESTGHHRNSDEDEESQALDGNCDGSTERTSLLPKPVIHGGGAVGREAYHKGKKQWDQLSPRARYALDFLYAFINAPMIGGVTGAIIGLTPPLHRVFFNSVNDGGIFNAWLTTSIHNIGNIFAALQIIVLGVKLSNCLRKMKRGEDSGDVSWTAMATVLIIRFILWPAISIGLIFLLASKTGLLGTDPILWFAMMLMPTGPSAMNLTSLTEVSNSSEGEKLSLAKFITISYILSPLMAFAVVGALKGSQGAIKVTSSL